MKNFKTFYEAQTARRLKEIIQSSHQIKASYVSGAKNLYGDTQEYTEKHPPEVFCKKFLEMVFLEISQNSQENTYARVSFLIKLRPEACNFIKKRLWHRCFPVNFVKFLRTPFSQNTSGRLLLYADICFSRFSGMQFLDV